VLDEIKQKQDRERDNRMGRYLLDKDVDIDVEGNDFELQRTSLSNIT
jgi:hypothetical protein